MARMNEKSEWEKILDTAPPKYPDSPKCKKCGLLCFFQLRRHISCQKCREKYFLEYDKVWKKQYDRERAGI